MSTSDDDWVWLALLALLFWKRKGDEAVMTSTPAPAAESTRGTMLEPYGAEVTVTREGVDWIFPVPTMVLPNGMVYSPHVTSAFGEPRKNPKPHNHAGVDIMYPRVDGKPPRKPGDHGSAGNWAPPGTPILAAADARVWSSQQTSRGWWVVLDHGPLPFATHYMHLDTVDFPEHRAGKRLGGAPSTRVAAGQQFGTMGFDPTDSALTRHLHFEVRRGTTPIDPASLDLKNWGRKTWHPTKTT